MRAKLLQQPQIDPETTKSQSEQEITAVSAEIQAEIDEDQEIKHKTAHQQFSKNEPEEDAEISDQENFQTIQIHTNLSSQLERQDEENKAQLYEPGSVDSNVTSGFEPATAGEWSELAGVVVLQRPPPEPPDLDPLVQITDKR
ncbi:hypothetical protein PIB30_001172 [Stylosanthes scabra]|uniref:Uncharacterized protein n=1 Tax=Stylosanthes scabra TaxID=79078 RepID=A0ABU6V3C9_9FABA|nr:hypothetical protein [Stylosanthes scabra]